MSLHEYSTPEVQILYLDIRTKFSTHPHFNGTVLTGCHYKSIQALFNYTYWLFNGTMKRRNHSKAGKYDITTGTYDFPTLHLKNYNESGNYQCVIYDPTRMKKPLLSHSINVKLPGN